jgi:hypothetical protein
MRTSVVRAAVYVVVTFMAMSAFASSGADSVSGEEGAVRPSTTTEKPAESKPSGIEFRHARFLQGVTLEGAELAAPEGMRVAIDAATGEFRLPTAEEIQALDGQRAPLRLSATSDSSLPVQLPNGTEMMPLDPNLMSYSHAWTEAEGARFTCMEGGADAHVLNPVIPAREEK